MDRWSDWNARLTDYLLAAGRQQIEPGRFDCMLFAAGAVRVMTGTDLAADYRGRYSTLKGGLRVLKRLGYADHVALIDALLGDRVGWMALRSGDVAAVPGDDGTPAIGVVTGDLIRCLAADGGLATVSLDAALFGWRVG